MKIVFNTILNMIFHYGWENIFHFYRKKSQKTLLLIADLPLIWIVKKTPWEKNIQPIFFPPFPLEFSVTWGLFWILMSWSQNNVLVKIPQYNYITGQYKQQFKRNKKTKNPFLPKCPISNPLSPVRLQALYWLTMSVA